MFEPILLDKNKDLNQVLDFLNLQLRADYNWSIEKEYPLTFYPDKLSHLAVIKDQERIISHAACKYLLIQTSFGLFKVAAIGSVITDPQYRDRGFSRKLINSLTQHALNQGCDFAVLWTDLYSFYQKMNFELAGYEISFSINQELDVSKQNLKFLKTAKVDPNAISRLYKKHTINSARPIENIKRCLDIPNSRVYTAWDSHNQLKSYAIEGRGADLNGCIHEWGGDLKYILPLLSEMYRSEGKALNLMTSHHTKKLNKTLIDMGLKKREGFLGMIKMLDTKALFFKIHRYARQLGIDNLVLEKNEDGYFYLGIGTNVFRTSSERDFTKIIFGPAEMHLIQGVDPTTKNILQNLLPIPMWIWGWDSI